MKSYNFICVLVLIFLTTSCNDDFVDITPLSEVSESSIWTDAGLAEAAVTNVYVGLGQGGYGTEMLASATDESLYTHSGSGLNVVNESRANSANVGWIKGENSWSNMYAAIRDANLAIEGLEGGDINNDNLRDRLMGEVKFLRAYYHHQLVRFYGGVPIADRTFTLDDDFNISRNTFEECVEFIVAECDEAFDLLDGKDLESGRATAGAALSLKARILLYAASDLHDITTASGNSSLISGYANQDLLGYTSGDQQTRWDRAKNASKAVLDYTSGYKFGLGSPVSFDEAKDNYMNVSTARNGGEADILWERQFIEAAGSNWGGRRFGLFHGPNGYHNWAGNTPTQNLIDAYAMDDGSDFDWDNPDHSSQPYEDREARFYATMLYDGADWKPRTPDVADRDPANQVQTGTYEILDGNGAVATHFGLDTRQGPIEDWNGTRTGYYVRKFIEPDPTHVDQTDFQSIPWPFFRYTEAVFNYAEACMETGNEDEAKAWLNQIRYRAGLPAITATGTELVEAYRRERQVELSYEEHRYHDARRWMIAEGTIGAPAGIINISGTLKPGANVTLYAYDTDNYDYTYTPGVIDPGFENRLWLDKSYFLPITNDELQANTSLVQNPGYE
ncbi:RagB/SusD family nutrient uptake outer membrane protein [Flavivirga algicola]|uniref:RagB/SusD family nutrient uptake outer membrane protein n=1 Tax=Flavivirga algicola TaxID=2729136 RepID=A0ABX1RUK7_9FLAO|nr:RagB/SusD family nutrient uptake outer membrane protein [Flavivirga algicola]NMH86753.1 RagB/SusD family nutrient uptake outer membrane protein [Flavivirga algicola]